MLGKGQGTVNHLMVVSVEGSLLGEGVQVSIVHVVRCCIYSFQTDVTPYYLDINMLLLLLELIQFRN